MVLKGIVMLYCLGVANAGVIGTTYASTPVVSTVFSPVITKTISPMVTKTVTPVLSKTITSPEGPIYESILTTHETKHKSSDGSSFSKTLDTTFSEINKYESRPLSTYDDSSLHPASSYGETAILGNKLLPVVKTGSPNVVHSGFGPVLINTGYHQDILFDQLIPLNNKVFPVIPKTISPPVVVTSPVQTKTITPVLKKSEIVTPVLTAHVTPALHTVSPFLTKTISPVVYNQLASKTYLEPVLKKTVSPATTPVKTAIAYSDAAVVSHMSFNGLGASYTW